MEGRGLVVFISKKIFNDIIYFYYIFGMINSSAVYVICINNINKGGGSILVSLTPKVLHSFTSKVHLT